jgi:hypothetical protein
VGVQQIQEQGRFEQQTLYEKLRNNAAKGTSDEPMEVMAIKYQFIDTPSETFSFLSRQWLFE